MPTPRFSPIPKAVGGGNAGGGRRFDMLAGLPIQQGTGNGNGMLVSGIRGAGAGRAGDCDA